MKINESTFNVLVGAQPVPSIECSLSKLQEKAQADCLGFFMSHLKSYIFKK